MAKTLLNGVNEVLKRVGEIQGDAAALTSLTDSPRQAYIDLAIQIWNELIDEVYSAASVPLPSILAEATITLATGDRDYALNSAVTVLRWPLRNETTGLSIEEYPGGYMAMVDEQLVPANYTGLANYAAIRPTDGQLYLDRIPTSVENGLVYKYRYEKDGVLDEAADTMPFTDKVFRAMVPAVSEFWRKRQERSFDEALAAGSMARAVKLLRMVPQATSYARKAYVGGMTPNWLHPYPDA